MPWSSTVPGCLSGLVTVFGPIGVTVLKGIVVGSSSRHEAITVGYSEMGPAVEAAVAVGGARAQTDTYIVHNLIKVASGSTTLDIVLERAFVIFNAVGEVLRANQTVGGAVTRARVGRYALSFEQPKGGAVAQIAFDIDVNAFAVIP